MKQQGLTFEFEGNLSELQDFLEANFKNSDSLVLNVRFADQQTYPVTRKHMSKKIEFQQLKLNVSMPEHSLESVVDELSRDAQGWLRLESSPKTFQDIKDAILMTVTILKEGDRNTALMTLCDILGLPSDAGVVIVAALQRVMMPAPRSVIPDTVNRCQIWLSENVSCTVYDSNTRSFAFCSWFSNQIHDEVRATVIECQTLLENNDESGAQEAVRVHLGLNQKNAQAFVKFLKEFEGNVQ